MPRRLVVLVGVADRLLLWWRSIGTNDAAATWLSHGRHVAQLGLNGDDRMRLFNHPPLIGYYALGLGPLRRPGLHRFAMFIKVPGLLGEVDPLGAVAMGEPSGRNGVCVSTGGDPRVGLPRQHRLPHGGLRPLRGDGRNGRYALAGLLFACALNVKIVPLVLLPLLLVALRRFDPWRGSPSAASSGCSPSFRPSRHAGRAMYRNMVEYQPRPENWGADGDAESGHQRGVDRRPGSHAARLVHRERSLRCRARRGCAGGLSRQRWHVPITAQCAIKQPSSSSSRLASGDCSTWPS